MSEVTKLLVAFSKQDSFSRNVFHKIEHRLVEVRRGPSYILYKLSDVWVLLEQERDLPFLDYLQDLVGELQVDHVLFVSRHEMKQPRPLLTVHTPGNWREAEYGGIPRKVSVSHAHFQSELARLLHRLASERQLLTEYEISIEATHHGPSLDVACTFVEVGSTEKEWSDPRCIDLFTQLLEIVLGEYDKLTRSDRKVVVSVGDLHYSTLTQHVLNGEYDIGHIIPKYIEFDRENLLMCVERTLPRPTEMIIHWKSLRKELRELAVQVAEELKLGIVKRK